MLTIVAGNAEQVRMFRCKLITDTGIKSLHQCIDLFVFDCPLIDMKTSLTELILRHSLLSVNANWEGLDKKWLYLLYNYGIIRLSYHRPKAVPSETTIPTCIRNIIYQICCKDRPQPLKDVNLK